jgi:N6-adenosine-specific RNA methylase IME4
MTNLIIPPPHPLKGKRYDVLLIDPPWQMWGDPNKDAAAGKHYQLMTDTDVNNLSLKKILKKDAYVFVWATTPRLNAAIEAIKAWGLHYRGVGHIWVKTRKDGGIINAQGIPPTYSKPTTEFLLVATTKKAGRPIKLINSKLPQVVLAPREGHSTKPEVFRELIESAFGTGYNMIEVFARKQVPGWDAIGNAVCNGEDVRDTIANII